jgi:hypothetical protein
VKSLDTDWSDLTDGPSFGGYVLLLLPRAAMLVLPALGIFGLVAVLKILEGSRLSRAMEPVFVGGGICLFIVGLTVLLVPGVAQNNRRRRDLVVSGQGEGRRVSWTATLLQPSGSFKGSLHFGEGRLRFLWHRPQGMDGKIQLEQEVLLQLDVGKIAAVERIAAPSLWEGIRYGSRQAAVLLRDGRRIRFAAPQPQGLVDALREELGRPEGTPVAPEVATALDQATLEELGHALTRRCERVILVAGGDAGSELHVVLQGPREALEASLGHAKAALASEEEAVRPFREARGT